MFDGVFPLVWQRWMWLFFVPWGFLWYIFEKYERSPSCKQLADNVGNRLSAMLQIDLLWDELEVA